jgi:hypothetical protein
LDTGCGFCGKTKSFAANAESEKTLVNTGGINGSQTEQIPDLELQNRCSTTELNWLTGKPSGAYFGRVRVNGKLIPAVFKRAG